MVNCDDDGGGGNDDKFCPILSKIQSGKTHPKVQFAGIATVLGHGVRKLGILLLVPCSRELCIWVRCSSNCNELTWLRNGEQKMVLGKL